MKKKRNRKIKKTGRFVRNFLLVISIALFVRLFLFEVYLVPSGSMVNTILPGEVLFVNKSVYGARLSVDPESCKETRVPGFSRIKHQDIVVLNFPGRDSIYKNRPDVDYHHNIWQQGHKGALNDTVEYGPLTYLPVKLRQPYVKRCIGLPGDTVSILRSIVFVNGQYSTCHANNWQHIKDSLDKGEPYEFLKNKYVPPKKDIKDYHYHFPHNIGEEWDNRSYGPLYVPKKGDMITLDYNNLSIYHRIITVFEHNKLDTVSGEIYINGNLSNTYTIKQDYYYMMGDNYLNSIDSRFWGFVPENHIIGKAVCVMWSRDNEKPGRFKVRFKRLFKRIN
jgi:signal peptidase I